MSDSKPHQFKPPLYHEEPARESSTGKSVVGAQARNNERRGWDAYRKWLSTVSARPPSERAPLDNSIYSWKGYHTWADRVKQAWKPEDN